MTPRLSVIVAYCFGEAAGVAFALSSFPAGDLAAAGLADGDAFGSTVGVVVGLPIGVMGDGEGGATLGLASGLLGTFGVPVQAPRTEMLTAIAAAKIIDLLIVFPLNFSKHGLEPPAS